VFLFFISFSLFLFYIFLLFFFTCKLLWRIVL